MRKNSYPYPIEFAEDIFAEGNTILIDTLKAVTGCEKPRMMLVADANVVQKTEGLGSKMGKYIKANGIELVDKPILLAGGERVKGDNWKSATRIEQAMLAAQVGHNDCLVAMGGGTVLDVASYAGAQVRGGVKIVKIPTTLAAQVDAAYADNAAMDYPGIKDAYRIVSAPSAVIVDTAFVKTVVDAVWRGGFAECLRVALPSDGPLAKKLIAHKDSFKARDEKYWGEVVQTLVALRMKKGETHFAQWGAFRLESMSSFKLPHGYATAIGIVMEANYAMNKGVMSEKDRNTVVNTLEECGALEGAVHSRHLVTQADSVLQGLEAWKLAMGSEAIVVPTGIGKSTVEETVDREMMKKSLQMIK